MAVIKQSNVVPYTNAQMYDLVIALENYPEFLPWCKRVTVKSKSPTRIDATVYGEKMGISFAVNITYLLSQNKLIDIRFFTGGGAVKLLQGYWRFDATNDGKTQFGFELQIEFANAFMNWTVIPIVRSEVKNAMKAFVERAKKIYG